MSHTKVDLLSLQGLNIVADIYISDYELVRRSWYERLFTRPWKPLVKYKSLYLPPMNILADGTILVSPKTKELITQMLLDKADKTDSKLTKTRN